MGNDMVEIKMKHTLTSEKILAAISVLETVVDVLKVISEHMKNEQNDDDKFVESADWKKEKSTVYLKHKIKQGGNKKFMDQIIGS